MKRVSLAAAAAVLSMAAIPALAQNAAPGPDVHFQGPNGEIQRGVRCAAERVSPEVQAEVERLLAAARERGQLAPPGDLTVPVAFHVLHNGTEGNIPDSMITAQLNVLNAAFNGTGFAFTLHSINRVNDRKWFTNCYGNQNFKRDLAVDVPHTLNFYTCKPKGNILGYAYLPQSYPEDNWHHGVVVLYSSLPGGSAAPYNLGDTGTHEVGHYLGLEHTFERGCQAPGDSVDDTPFEASPAFGCPTGRDTCSQPGLDPIENFMDYTDDACMDTFSAGQSGRMSEIVAVYKPSLGH
jgi:pregnancy-associated plasma protein-A